MKGKCFIEPLFHKVVSGNITQFREIIKPHPEGEIFPVLRTGKNGWKEVDRIGNGKGYGYADTDFGFFRPRYRVGEKLYLKEPYDRSYIPEIGDKYDNPLQAAGDPKCWETIYRYDGIYIDAEWKNSLLMPAKYARYFIKITGVRAEKLQDISSEDCIKGGIVAIPQKYNGAFIYDNLLDRERYNTPVQACAALIDRIGGRGTWKNNPYVWVYDFKLATLQGDRQINYRVKQ